MVDIDGKLMFFVCAWPNIVQALNLTHPGNSVQAQPYDKGADRDLEICSTESVEIGAMLSLDGGSLVTVFVTSPTRARDDDFSGPLQGRRPKLSL